MQNSRRLVTIRVYGRPAPQGSKIRTKWGMRESSKFLPAWRDAIREAAKQYLDNHAGDFPIVDACNLDVTFYIERPASIKRNRRPLPVVKPDWDKLARTMDSLTDAGILLDDCLITDAQVRKRYADDEDPGALIKITLI